jgi:CelD/BcsL family acetyltransferase involved in cellulose biosynthesis
MIVDIVTDIEPIENLQQDWSSLLMRASLNNLFLTWEWIFSWCRNMMSRSETPFIITAREGNRLLGVAPAVIVRRKNLGTYVQFLGQSYSYHLGFIAEKGNEERIYNALWNHILDHVIKKFRAIEFLHFEENASFESVLQRQADKRGLYIERSIQNPCKVLKLSDTYPDYLKSGILSYNLRQNLKKDFRRLGKECQVDFFHADKTNFQKYWLELLSLHCEMMQNRNKDSALMGNSFPQHLRQVSEIFHEKEELRLNVLVLNQETAAIILGIIYNGVFNALTIGLNHRLIRKMPWLNLCVLSLALSIKTAIECGCKEFDFLGGHHEYKYKMGGKDKAGIKIKIYRSGIQKLKEQSLLRLISIMAEALKIKSYLVPNIFLRKKSDRN